MRWRLAKSLTVLRDEVNARAPQRSKVSDGTLGDTAHAARRSDHNPDADGVVCAIDITDDPVHGHDDRVFAEHLRQLGAAGDKRVKYVISNGYVASRTDNWDWRVYTGVNAHAQHTHLSVTQEGKDSTAPWGWHVTTQKDWFDMATKQELADVVDAAFAKQSAAKVLKVSDGPQHYLIIGNRFASYISNPGNLQDFATELGMHPESGKHPRSWVEDKFVVG
jgi:hypothetical protein